MSGKNTKSAKKKKHIAKHILRAQAKKHKEEAGAEGAGATTTPKKKKKSKKANTHVKDPKEAHQYLSTWKYRETAPESWKFNKNTQSWLFRHMYDVEKLPKAFFALLMEYLEGLKGSTRDWVNKDAVRRVLRYKEWEKNGGSEGSGGETKEENEESSAKSDHDEKDEDIADDDKNFQKLSDHDKRKEYKRARKVVETIKKSNPTSAGEE